MAPATLAQVFEPFFTTKAPGEGTGLGLSMVFGFVKQSRGHIKIYSEVGLGTCVRLYLPRAAPGATAVAAAGEATPRLRRGRETILVVEDNADVRRTVVAQLTELGYAVVEAASPQEALARLRGQPTGIDLLFTDIVMPGGMNGHDLARAALAEWPGLKVLFTSGYSGTALRDDDRLREGEHFLSKPYRRHELADKLREIFGRGAT
jgi:CheY-like chemotaxis protein